MVVNSIAKANNPPMVVIFEVNGYHWIPLGGKWYRSVARIVKKIKE
jgi:hypothetical protein